MQPGGRAGHPGRHLGGPSDPPGHRGLVGGPNLGARCPRAPLSPGPLPEARDWSIPAAGVRAGTRVLRSPQLLSAWPAPQMAPSARAHARRWCGWTAPRTRGQVLLRPVPPASRWAPAEHRGLYPLSLLVTGSRTHPSAVGPAGKPSLWGLRSASPGEEEGGTDGQPAASSDCPSARRTPHAARGRAQLRGLGAFTARAPATKADLRTFRAASERSPGAR